MYRQALFRTIAGTLFCGLVLLAILFLLNRLIPLPMQMSSISWIIISVAVILGVCLSVKHRKDLLSVAQVVDEKMELKERLGTAFELIQSNPQGEFAQFQIQDAAETVTTLDIEKNKPIPCPKVIASVSDSSFVDRDFFHNSTFLRGARTTHRVAAAGAESGNPKS
jgi:hypothetical protein